mgnify:CR=1 FL=1
MAIQKEEVSIDVQDIVELLHSGYTWFKKDDLGYGSIQEKFNALDIHIKTIQKHPELANVDTIAKVFVITNRNKTDKTMERFITFLCKRYFFPFIKISPKTSNIDTIPLIIALIFANMWGSKLTSIFKFNSCKL